MAAKVNLGTRGGWLVALGFLIVGLSGFLTFDSHSKTLIAWLFIAQMAALSAIVVGFGFGISGRIGGFALSGSYTYSLSRLQVACWTILVVAAIFTAAEFRLFSAIATHDQHTNPLGFSIPSELLQLLGISLFSATAAPSLLALKSTQPEHDDATNDAAAGRAAAHAGIDPKNVDNVGLVMTRTDPRAARWTDIVSGEEVGNAGTLDLSKVQQLLVTILLLTIYASRVVTEIKSDQPFATTLPSLDEQFVYLLAISHAGYLAYKASPKTVSGQTQTSSSPSGFISPQAAPPRSL